MKNIRQRYTTMPLSLQNMMPYLIFQFWPDFVPSESLITINFIFRTILTYKKWKEKLTIIHRIHIGLIWKQALSSTKICHSARKITDSSKNVEPQQPIIVFSKTIYTNLPSVTKLPSSCPVWTMSWNNFMKTATSSDADQNATLSSQNNLSTSKYFWKRWRGSGEELITNIEITFR